MKSKMANVNNPIDNYSTFICEKEIIALSHLVHIHMSLCYNDLL